MDHSHSHVNGGSESTTLIGNQAGSGGFHGAHVPDFINEINESGESELLEMLHMPILHGGVKEVLLLSSLTTSSAGSFTIACLLLVILVALLELLRLLAWWIENHYSGGNSMMSSVCECKHCSSLTSKNVMGVGEWKQYDAIHDSSLPPSESSKTLSATKPQTRWLIWFGVGGLQFLVYLFATLLMLIAMTMNIYLIISMAVGSAIGKMSVVCIKKKLLDSRK